MGSLQSDDWIGHPIPTRVVKDHERPRRDKLEDSPIYPIIIPRESLNISTIMEIPSVQCLGQQRIDLGSFSNT